jgi:hypothetical protein
MTSQKPVAPDFDDVSIENTQEGAKLKSSDTPKESPIIDINRGKVEKSVFKNIESLKPKRIIDISKPYYTNALKETFARNKSLSYERPHSEPEIKPENKEPKKRSENLEGGAVGLSTKPQLTEDVKSTHVSSLITFTDNEVILKTSTMSQPSSAIETNTNALAEQKSEANTGSIILTETQTEAFTKVATQTEPKTSARQSSNIELATAENMLTSTLARQESVSLTKARQAIAEAVRQENSDDVSHATQDTQKEHVSYEVSKKREKRHWKRGQLRCFITERRKCWIHKKMNKKRR